MYRHLSILFLVALLACLFTSRAFAQAAPNAPVQGTIKSVAQDKASFVVTVKKADVTVNLSKDTRFTRDDMPSDAAKALTVGADVNAILNADRTAFVVLATTVPVKGAVKSVAADNGSFVVTLKTGEDVTVKVNAATKYTLDKNPSTMALALVAGNTATATLDAGGMATDVAAKTAKAPKTPTPVPAPATAPLP